MIADGWAHDLVRAPQILRDNVVLSEWWSPSPLSVDEYQRKYKDTLWWRLDLYVPFPSSHLLSGLTEARRYEKDHAKYQLWPRYTSKLVNQIVSSESGALPRSSASHARDSRREPGHSGAERRA